LIVIELTVIKKSSKNVMMLQADWSFLISEPAIDLVVTTFDAAPVAIMVLGKLIHLIVFLHVMHIQL